MTSSDHIYYAYVPHKTIIGTYFYYVQRSLLSSYLISTGRSQGIAGSLSFLWKFLKIFWIGISSLSPLKNLKPTIITILPPYAEDRDRIFVRFWVYVRSPLLCFFLSSRMHSWIINLFFFSFTGFGLGVGIKKGGRINQALLPPRRNPKKKKERSKLFWFSSYEGSRLMDEEVIIHGCS